MEQEKEGSLWKEFFADIAAGMLIAAGLRNFALHADFPVAGFTGIAVILYHVAGIPVGAGTVLLNIPVAILCYRSLGKAFFFRSVRSTLIVSFLTDYIAPLFPVYTGDRLLAALCTGGLCGMGYALIFLQGSSTGGQDFISLWIRKKRPYLSLGAITFALDGVIILLGTALVFRDMDGLICGVLVTGVLAGVINKVLYGSGRGRLAMIVTEKGEEIAAGISLESGRGATILRGVGAGSGKKKEVVICACDNKQIHRIKRAVHERDPWAFTIILESGEVVGEGFSRAN